MLNSIMPLDGGLLAGKVLAAGLIALEDNPAVGLQHSFVAVPVLPVPVVA